eukprot:7797424-Alexandrium_andersonii.AAC.1
MAGLPMLIRASGALAGGLAIFLEPFAWDAEKSADPYDSKPALEWVKRARPEKGAPPEAPLDYLGRALVESTTWGLALGEREVAVRKTAIVGVHAATHWRLEGLPRHWAEVDGFTEVAIAGRPWQAKSGT